MFKIIGADQKQYGPISEAQIRRWISDGRINEHTQAQREGSNDWQPLSAFDEFADIFRPSEPAPSSTFAPPPAPLAPMGAPMATGSRDSALSAVKGPAIALIVVAAVGIALNLLCAVGVATSHDLYRNMPNLTPEQRSVLEHFEGASGAIVYLIGAALYGFVLFGALKMMRLQSFNLALAACIIAMLPCSCCCLLGLPFGIWGLVMLNKTEVKSQFDLP